MALWDAAILRLLVPFCIPWRFAPRALLGTAGPAIASTVAKMMGQTAQTSGLAGNVSGLNAAQTVNPTLDMTLETAHQGTFQTAQDVFRVANPVAAWRSMLFAVWIAGALAIGAAMLIRYVRSMRAFAESLPDGDPRTARFLAEHPTLRRVQVRVSGAIASPLSYGVLRPVILLPKGMDRQSDQALSFVLMHEMSHILAMDALRKLLLLLCVCLHWMNPAVYLLLLLASRDMELLCDERVLAACGPGARRTYALTLLDMEEKRMTLSPVSSPFSMTAIEERIETMKNMKKKSAFSALIALMMVSVAVVALATDMPEEPVVTGTVFATDALTAQEPSLSMGTGATTGLEIVNHGEWEVSILEDPSPRLAEESWEKVYSKYEPFGLGYDTRSGRLTFEGKIVRRFEDMVPVGDGGSAGTVCQFADGEVDVLAERDLTAPIVRAEDGSYDPFETYPITGLRVATWEEFDEYKRVLEAIPAQGAVIGDPDSVASAVTIWSEAIQTEDGASIGEAVEGEALQAADTPYTTVQDIVIATVEGGEITYISPKSTYIVEDTAYGVSVKPAQAGEGVQIALVQEAAGNATESADAVEDTVYTVTMSGAKDGNDAQVTSVPGGTGNAPDIVWWTADEYRAWMEQERVQLEELAAQGGALFWTQARGWVEWTPAEVERAMALYESILEQIESGTMISKTVDGSGDLVLTRPFDAQQK